MSPTDTARISRHLDAFDRAWSDLEEAKRSRDVHAQARAAFSAASESLKAAAARYGIEHEGPGGLMDLSARLSKIIGAACLPSRLASILCLDPRDPGRLPPPARMRRALAKAEEIAFNLADIARGGSNEIH